MRENAINHLIGHCIATLPDSLKERKGLLRDVLAVMHRRHPLRKRVTAILLLLESHELHQLNLSLDFSKEDLTAKTAKKNSNPKHDGN